MGIAMLSSMRSKDPNTQVGACIVNQDRKIVGVGYNGFPTGCSDDELPWQREGEWLEAELELERLAETCARHVALFPCNECAKAIIQSGIKKVIYLSDKYADTDGTKASRRMLTQAGVELVQLRPEKEELVIKFK